MNTESRLRFPRIGSEMFDRCLQTGSTPSPIGIAVDILKTAIVTTANTATALLMIPIRLFASPSQGPVHTAPKRTSGYDRGDSDFLD